MKTPFLLLKVGNGGWIVRQAPEHNSPYSGVEIGAFTTTDDLLNWLSQELPSAYAPAVYLDGREQS